MIQAVIRFRLAVQVFDQPVACLRVELSRFSRRHRARRTARPAQALDGGAPRASIEAGDAHAEASARDGLIQRVVLAAGAALNQRLLRSRVGFGLQTAPRALQGIVGIDVGQIG
ncbi:MAG TPA: hypothetical protein VJV78_18260 [Polyangiales bacterium]|nr:hypothetical protein [Polyangiales bacterium]